MLTLNLKLVALLVTSANVVLLPIALPEFEINITPNPSAPPFIPKLVLNDQCKPDLPFLLTQNFTDLRGAYETCARQLKESGSKTHPDEKRSTGEIIRAYGYPLEIHKVTTKDGYILTVHRIPRKGGLPVYLQHGLGGCSDNWVLQYRNKSLAFLLFEHGYDVWLANFRGTTYSLEHKTRKWNHPRDFSYWDFSHHEVGVYDVPAITHYVSAVTGYPKITYIGHSMGTTTYLVAVDRVPALNDKLLAGILLAPAGFVSRTTSPFRTLGPLMGAVPNYLEPVFKGRMDFQRPDNIQKALNKTKAELCSPTAARCGACGHFMFSLYGLNAAQINYTNIPNLLVKYPNVASMKSAFHYAQSVDQCTFREFDYGILKNLRVYNRTSPPDYTLKNVRVPTYSFYGDFDNMCRPKDILKTLGMLPEGTLKANIRVNSTYFNHIDFLLAKDAQTLVYTKILDILHEITNKK